ncbi:MAG: MarR family transcriptional regulator [Candidatus Thorarchaeota archaeon]|nr:MarR family transcriptional regulator [Candidatus Thorarchaeota archaeon]
MSFSIPKSARIVLHSLATTGPMSPKEISRRSEIPLRTVSFALRKLTAQNLLRRIPNLQDMRQPLYNLESKEVKAHLIKHGADSLIKMPNTLLDMRKTI